MQLIVLTEVISSTVVVCFAHAGSTPNRTETTFAEKAVRILDCENVFIQSNSEQEKHSHRPTRSGHTQKKTMEGLDHGSQSGKTTVTRHTTAAGRAASQEHPNGPTCPMRSTKRPIEQPKRTAAFLIKPRLLSHLHTKGATITVGIAITTTLPECPCLLPPITTNDGPTDETRDGKDDSSRPGHPTKEPPYEYCP